MRKALTVISAIVISTAISSAYAKPTYSYTQLDKFETTNACVGCDLSGARLENNHSNAKLDNANLSGIVSKDTYGLNLSMASLKNANFSGAFLEYANFSQADLTDAHFDGASLFHANFYGATGANLANAKLCHTILADGSDSGCEGGSR